LKSFLIWLAYRDLFYENECDYNPTEEEVILENSFGHAPTGVITSPIVKCFSVASKIAVGDADFQDGKIEIEIFGNYTNDANNFTRIGTRDLYGTGGINKTLAEIRGRGMFLLSVPFSTS